MIQEQGTAKLFQKRNEAQFVPQALQSFFDSVYWTGLGKWSEIFQCRIYLSKKGAEEDNSEGGESCLS